MRVPPGKPEYDSSRRGIRKIQNRLESIIHSVECARAGKPVVFTNGVFDILHAGHVQLLTQAKGLGSLLVVGVNSDASVKRLGKGDDRPINPEEDRLAIIRAISGVDFAFIFDEDTPEESIRRLSPVIHVKGGDYTFDQLPEAKEVLSGNGIVAILPTLKGRSTTRIAETIRRK